MNTPGAYKAALRRDLLAARKALPIEIHAAEADALTAAVRGRFAGVVCAYWPLVGEPGSAAVIDALRDDGCQVLLPIVVGDAPLDWATYDGPASMRPASHGLSEPANPPLGHEAVKCADTMLVPALAVDRHGVRLGRGGGHYDRTLQHVMPHTRTIAVIRDDEFVDALPKDRHDIPVSAVLTPHGGLIELR